jgi:EpsI family protein
MAKTTMVKTTMVKTTVVKTRSFASVRYGLLGAACLILVLQASASRMLKIDERSLPIPGLHNLPWQVGNWKAAGEQSIGPEIEAYLKPDEYILRDYADPQQGAPINLFVAYFKSLQNTYGPHSPSVCLPGAGWMVSASKILNITVPGRAEAVPANEYTMEKAGERLLVLYWYQNDRDVWAQEFHAKLRLLPDLIRYRRSDVSLVRLITRLRGAAPDDELNNCVRFTDQMFPLLADRFASIH